MEIDRKDDGPITFYSGLLSVAEVGLGSILHAFHIPFRGYFLSLNQIFILTRALLEVPKIERNLIPFYISNIAATVKSLAPMGKRLTPMLAIAAQGLLYNSGILLFGNNLMGRITGAGLSALWGFAQPLLIYYAIFGKTLMDSFLYFNVQFTKGFFLVFAISCIAFKMFLSFIIVLFAPYLNVSRFERYTQLLSQVSEKVKGDGMEKSPKNKGTTWLIRNTFKDLCRPLFLFSLFTTALFLYFVNASPKWLIWGILRPIALSFVLFFILRLFSAKNGVERSRFLIKKLESFRSQRD